VSLAVIASSTRLRRNAGSTPRAAETTISARTAPRRPLYGANRGPIRRRFARRRAGSAGRSGASCAEWKNMPIGVRVRPVADPAKIAVVYYSATGNVHGLAQAVAEGAESAHAEVR